jgi:hypothetical protein
VTDMSWVHDTALGPFGDGTRGDFDLGVSTDVLVEDLGAVKHGFGSDTLGLRGEFVSVGHCLRWTHCVEPL